MAKSAGIVLYRKVAANTEFFLVHPGGPYFTKKNEGWWTIPKGEIMPGEEPLDTAIREFEEETGYKPRGPFTPLEPITQKGGKQVFAWACAGDVDAANITCNTFEIEWPPKSGRRKLYPEVDKAGWFTPDEARKLINDKQVLLLDQVLQLQE